MSAQSSPAVVQVVVKGNLGTTFKQNGVTKLYDVFLSAQAGNQITFGSDNGISLPPYNSGQTSQPYNYNTAI